MTFAPVLITAATAAALTLQEAKDHLNLDHDDDDALVTSLIKVAQEHLDGPEGILSRILMDSVWEETIDVRNSKCIDLCYNPISAIVSVTNDGDSVTAYDLRQKDTGQYRIIFTEVQTGEIVVRYSAGAESAEEVPEPLKQAMRLHIGSLYEMREMEAVGVSVSDLPHYDILVGPYRRRRVG